MTRRTDRKAILIRDRDDKLYDHKSREIDRRTFRIEIDLPGGRLLIPKEPRSSTFPENALSFVSSSEPVRNIATWLPASRAILDDLDELNGFIMSSLPYYVALEEELQFLAGDGTGQNLHGFLSQASAFNASLLSASAGWNRLDIVGRGMQQLAVAKEIPPTFLICHPNDWYSMRLQKDGFGRFILGDPGSIVRPSIFGLDVVATTSISSGNFSHGHRRSCGLRDTRQNGHAGGTLHFSFRLLRPRARGCEV